MKGCVTHETYFSEYCFIISNGARPIPHTDVVNIYIYNTKHTSELLLITYCIIMVFIIIKLVYN